MPDEAPDYRALLDELGYPPIRGGAEDEPDDPAEDTPAPDAPEPTDSPEPGEDGTRAEPDATDTTNWQERWEQESKRVSDLHGIATQSQQEAARYRQIFELAQQGDPKAKAALLAAAGYEAPEDTEPEDDDLTAEERVARVEQQLAAREASERQSAEEQETEQAWQNFYEAEFKKLDPEGQLPDEERSLIVGAAHQLPPANDGLPDLAAGKKAIDDRFEARQQAYLDSKKAPRVGVGTAGQKKVDLRDDDARRNLMVEIAEAESGES